jgi:Fe2+ or Zn2+ uptake regulation protein
LLTTKWSGTVAVVKTPEQLTERFRSQGLKVTPQRQAIFRVLHGHQGHPTAETVHAQIVRDLPMVSRRTVYQTLNDLTAMGELGQIDVGTGSARFDPNLDPHHHLVCDDCGRVVDLVADVAEVTPPDRSVIDFEVRRIEIVFRGRCSACAACAESTTAQPAKPTHQHQGGLTPSWLSSEGPRPKRT